MVPRGGAHQSSSFSDLHPHALPPIPSISPKILPPANPTAFFGLIRTLTVLNVRNVQTEVSMIDTIYSILTTGFTHYLAAMAGAIIAWFIAMSFVAQENG
jgi:hypothetical protein